ncbi:hypothetical protein HMPREF2141_02190 [Bacteroides uniformis]|nr:hypothetical protein HMPREF2141_02190 [Bacteroides uniformis]
MFTNNVYVCVGIKLRMISTKLFNCSRKGLYRRLPQTATLGLVAFVLLI